MPLQVSPNVCAALQQMAAALDAGDLATATQIQVRSLLGIVCPTRLPAQLLFFLWMVLCKDMSWHG